MGKHSVRDLECLFSACSVRLFAYTDLLARGFSLSFKLRFRLGTVGRNGYTYAGAREVLRKVEKQTLHWMSLADSLTLSWDLASLPAFFAARSRFCADLAPCVCQDGGQRSEIGDR